VFPLAIAADKSASLIVWSGGALFTIAKGTTTAESPGGQHGYEFLHTKIGNSTVAIRIAPQSKRMPNLALQSTAPFLRSSDMSS
jgi:hypothetical protein